jgi:hypothetical protein
MIRHIFATVLATLAITAQASGSHDLEFEARDQYDDVRLAWYVVQDVPQTCAMAGALKGAKVRYNPNIIACAVVFPTSNACVIYTAKKLTLAVLGHEVRHCFEGAWHP